MITCEEKFGSREVTLGQGAGAVLNFVIKGTDDDQIALDTLEATAPATHQDMVPISISVEPVANQIWFGMVKYGFPSSSQAGQSVFNFDTGGGSQHITQSLQTKQSYAAPGKQAANFGGAIGVSQQSVEGVDIAVPVFNFSETHYLDDGDVTPSYQDTLFILTGTINNAGWRWFDEGEVLFLGASGSKRAAGDWEINYRFAASPNRSGIIIGDITGITKGGWDYLWVRYQDSEDTAAKQLVKKPVAVYIEQVYQLTNFNLLGI